MSIEVRGVGKRFGSFQAAADVTFAAPDGQITSLLGPSGSGKSTVLRIIAGLEPPDEGEVFITGAHATHQRAQDRGIGFVFQHYALFRHMTVAENVGFGLSVRKVPRREIDARVAELESENEALKEHLQRLEAAAAAQQVRCACAHHALCSCSAG